MVAICRISFLSNPFRCSYTSWYHVKSRHNPAELGDLLRNKLWWNGPEWLSLSADPWTSVKNEPVDIGETPPKEKFSKVVEVHSSAVIVSNDSVDMGETPPKKKASKVFKVNLTTLTSYTWGLVERYSSLFKLLRVTSYCLSRF